MKNDQEGEQCTFFFCVVVSKSKSLENYIIFAYIEEAPNLRAVQPYWTLGQTLVSTPPFKVLIHMFDCKLIGWSSEHIFNYISFPG